MVEDFNKKSYVTFYHLAWHPFVECFCGLNVFLGFQNDGGVEDLLQMAPGRV